MARRGLVWACCMLLAATPNGCGTLANVGPAGTRQVYGGVRLSAQAGSRYLADLSKDCAGCSAMVLPLAGYFLVIDVPLCVLADTLTLPLTILAPDAPEN